MRISPRLLAIPIALAMLGLFAPTASARLTPPGNGVAASSCQTLHIAYYPLYGPNGSSGWAYIGQFPLRLCVVRGTGGWIWASSQLTGPADGVHTRFTGGWTVRLQGCSPRSAVTIATAVDNWDGSQHPIYDYATSSGGTYRWSTVYTPNVSPSYSSYRVMATANAGSVVPNTVTAFSYALASGGLNASETYYSNCTGV